MLHGSTEIQWLSLKICRSGLVDGMPSQLREEQHLSSTFPEAAATTTTTTTNYCFVIATCSSPGSSNTSTPLHSKRSCCSHTSTQSRSIGGDQVKCWEENWSTFDCLHRGQIPQHVLSSALWRPESGKYCLRQSLQMGVQFPS